MRVEVTQEDIDRAREPFAFNCPIEFALLRDFGAVSVGQSWIHVVRAEGDKAQCIKTPSRASRFIAAFDNDRQVKPLSFELEAE